MSCWIRGVSTDSGKHITSVRENPQQVLHFISVLPAASDCQCLQRTHTNKLRNKTLTNITLWQVKVQRLSVIVSDCKNILEGIHKQTVILRKIFRVHRVWLAQPINWFQQLPKSLPQLFTILGLFYAISLCLGGVWVTLLMDTFVTDVCKILSRHF